jgi:hypothetical protein
MRSVLPSQSFFGGAPSKEEDKKIPEGIFLFPNFWLSILQDNLLLNGYYHRAHREHREKTTHLKRGGS